MKFYKLSSQQRKNIYEGLIAVDRANECDGGVAAAAAAQKANWAKRGSITATPTPPPPLRCRHRFLSSDRPRLPSSLLRCPLRVFPSSFRQRRRRSFLASLSLGLSPPPSLGWTDSRRTDGGKSGQMDAKYANRERGRERHTESRFLKVKCSCSLWSFCLWSPAGCTSLNLIVETSSFPRR